MKEKLIVSVSGGRTSAYMAKMLKENFSDQYDLIYIFANTGREHPDTLRFMRDVDVNFELGVVWLECVVNTGYRKVTTHKIVNFETAARDGQPFEDVLAKYGIPNVKFLHCTRELKLRPIDSYLRSIGAIKATRAIGIREDERRRVSKNALAARIVYPLVDWFPADKIDVLDFWSQFSWDLKIPEWQGNCVTCHKKSFKKLKKVYQETPEVFEWSALMEDKYAELRRERSVFFRQAMDTNSIVKAFELTDDSPVKFINREDAGCSESCEIYSMEQK